MSQKYQNRYRIPSTRHNGWDYSNDGGYFITICTKNREHIFGDIINGKLIETFAADIFRNLWLSLPTFYLSLILDEMVIMPDHIHFIVFINSPTVETIHESSLINKETIHELSLLENRRKMLISKIVGRLKMQSSKQINLNLNRGLVSVWQPNYYDRIIRNEDELLRIRKYINENPMKWENENQHIENFYM